MALYGHQVLCPVSAREKHPGTGHLINEHGFLPALEIGQEVLQRADLGSRNELPSVFSERSSQVSIVNQIAHTLRLKFCSFPPSLGTKMSKSAV